MKVKEILKEGYFRKTRFSHNKFKCIPDEFLYDNINSNIDKILDELTAVRIVGIENGDMSYDNDNFVYYSTEEHINRIRQLNRNMDISILLGEATTEQEYYFEVYADVLGENVAYFPHPLIGNKN